MTNAERLWQQIREHGRTWRNAHLDDLNDTLDDVALEAHPNIVALSMVKDVRELLNGPTWDRQTRKSIRFRLQEIDILSR